MPPAKSLAKPLVACALLAASCARQTTPPSAAPSRPVALPEDETAQAEAQIKRLLEKGDTAAALSFAQEFHRKTLERRGPEHLETAKALVFLAMAETAGGSPGEAQNLLARARATQERLLGSHHRDVGQTLRYLAATSYQLGQLPEAAQSASQAISILEQTLGANHPDVANALTTLGHARLALKDARAASAAWTRALEIRTRALGPTDALVGISAASVATAEWTAGDQPKAAAHFEQALAVFEQHLDTRLDEFADVAGRLVSLRGRDDPEAAEALLRRAMSVVESRRGRRDVSFLQLAFALNALLVSLGRDSEIGTMLDELGAAERCLPAGACASSTEPPGKESSLRLSNVSQVIAELRPKFRACYNDGLRRDAAMQGIARLTLRVANSGTASWAKSKSLGLDDPAVSCILESALAARFAASGKGSALVVVPITFVRDLGPKR